LSNADVVRILKEARRLLEHNGRLGQGNYRTVQGRRCALRTICDASIMLDSKPARNLEGDLLDLVARRLGYITTERMNDGSTHEQMLIAFDEAISAAGVADRRMTEVEPCRDLMKRGTKIAGLCSDDLNPARRHLRNATSCPGAHCCSSFVGLR
jgi:hypothetical protein